MGIEVLGTHGQGPLTGRFLTNAAKANGLVFTTLHHGFDPATYDRATETGELPADAGEQTAYALHELGQVLKDAGARLDDVVKVNLYVDSDNHDELEIVQQSFLRFFRAHNIATPPPLTFLAVTLCGVKVAADLVAIHGDTPGKVSSVGRFKFIGAQSAVARGAQLSFSDQIKACLTEVDRLLEHAGLRIEDVAKVTTFLVAEMMSVEGYAAYNVAYNEFFADRGILRKPARSTVGVGFLNAAELVQIEAIAAL